ncbi:hypothetical protein V2P44_00605 [Mycoplasma leachii]|uniref:hypothetical protein n=1 Tax=Mycoplasma leachii TaxID=2105 RepID=UPI000674B93E|nr:hypothetical protein [Mycoplasma leachii]
MARQLKVNEWIELINLYYTFLNDLISKSTFIWKMKKLKNVDYISCHMIRLLRKKHRLYNLGMKLEESKTGTAPKKGKGSGRSKKSQDIWRKLKWHFKTF